VSADGRSKQDPIQGQDKGTTGFQQDVMLKSVADAAASVQPLTVREPGVWALCVSTMLGPRLRG
jgi:hypothetical protein